MIGLLLGVALAAPTLRVEPANRLLGVPMGTGWVPRDSTLQLASHECPDGEQSVQIVSVNEWYRVKGVEVVAPGEVGCLPKSVLKDRKVQLEPAEQRLKQFFEQRFGSIPTAAIQSTPWNRVALPMVRELTPAELERVYKREGLLTAKQRERAVIAEGPMRDGKPIYAHFLGSDAPRSDRWATPSTIERLLVLADEWAMYCRNRLSKTMPEANADSCLLQIGDLAWYNDLRPDPLGHREHYLGECVDIRLFRSPASRYEAYWNREDDRAGERGGYSRSLTQAFLRFAVEHAAPTVVHFNDPVVVQRIPMVTPARGHDDHIHMCF